MKRDQKKAQKDGGISVEAVRWGSGFPAKDGRTLQARAQRQGQKVMENKDRFKVVGAKTCGAGARNESGKELWALEYWVCQDKSLDLYPYVWGSFKGHLGLVSDITCLILPDNSGSSMDGKGSIEEAILESTQDLMGSVYHDRECRVYIRREGVHIRPLIC